MTLLQIHVFVAIADTGSFTRAGMKLNLTQSAVSQTLAGLESEIGLTLFHRGKSGVTLTDAGTQLLPHAREMLGGETQFKEAAASLLGLSLGSLTIGCFPSFMASRMPRLVKGFRDAHPGLSISFKEGNYEEITAWLTDGTIDVGFNVYAASPLRFIPLLEDPLLLVMPEGHPFADAETIAIAQILGEPFVRDTGCEHFMERLFPDPHLQPNSLFGVRDTLAILAMVQAGVGVTVLPKMSVPDYLTGIRTCELAPPLVRTIGICHHTRRTLSPGGSAFIRYVTDLERNGVG